MLVSSSWAGSAEQWCGDDHRTLRRQAVQVPQLGQAVLVRAMEVPVAGIGLVGEAAGLAGVRPDRLHTDTDDRGLFGEPAGALRRQHQVYARYRTRCGKPTG